MSDNQNRSADDDVYIIRKLLEQIHNYFEYLECPYYNSDISERDLLLLLIQPSEKRYHLLEWMINRLEPDIDFYLPTDYGEGEFAIEPNIKKDYINAISYLKNLGLCYSRVMVPDIVHAKVGPLVQLKFLVRLLRGIRLKSWNRRPIIKKIVSPIKEKFISDQIVKEDKSEIVFENISKLVVKSSNKNILKLIHERIENNRTAKTILEVLENRLDAEQILSIKEKLYFSLIKKLTVKRNLKTKTDPISQISMNSSNMSFADGMIQLIIEEVLSPEVLDDRSSLCSSNSCDSCCSLTVKNFITDSRSTSKCSGDIIEKCNQILLKKNPNFEINNENLFKQVSKSYSTSINLTKKLTCNGDDCANQKELTSIDKGFYRPLQILNEFKEIKNN